jgi:predicted metalloprotease with PDZ domain
MHKKPKGNRSKAVMMADTAQSKHTSLTRTPQNSAQQHSSTAIEYALSFDQYGEHLIDVQMTFTASAAQELWLPVWVPGSYLVREFARHLSTPRAERVGSAQPIPLEKITKNRWRLNTQAGEQIQLSYQVYAFDLSVRGAYLDQTRAYVNFACTCLAVAGQEHLPINLTLRPGVGFADLPIACSLPVLSKANRDALHFHALNYSDFIDHPVEIAAQTWAEFSVAGIPHQVAISGRHHTNMTRLAADLAKICQYEIELFGGAPFKDYLFMVMATGSSYGGLEHQNCTSLITPREDLPQANEPLQPSASYRRFLGLCSHEYFHAWLVKFIRPQEFAVLDLEREVYTRMLWVFEGFTSYYDDLILYRSGVIDQAAYLELLGEQLSRYHQNSGRAHQSVSDSSFDAWIKYYRPDENSQNASTSYYNKGALIALCLDLTLRAKGKSLDDIMRALYQHAQAGQYLTAETLPTLCETLIGDALPDFWRDYVYGNIELPLEQLLSEVGVHPAVEQKVWPLGLKTSDSPQGLLIQQVLRGSVAAQAGLSAHDTLIAIDGIRANATLLAQWSDAAGFHAQASATSGHLLTCHVFRRDELMTFTLAPKASTLSSVRLNVVDQERLKGWLTVEKQTASA